MTIFETKNTTGISSKMSNNVNSVNNLVVINKCVNKVKDN